MGFALCLVSLWLWLEERVFQIWALAIDDLVQSEILIQPWSRPVVDLAVDYWNGFAYLLTSGGEWLYKLPLPVQLSPQAAPPPAQLIRKVWTVGSHTQNRHYWSSSWI